MQIFFRRKSLIIAGLTPLLSVFTLFVIVPIAGSFYFSFFSWDGFSPRQWVGLDNYAKLIQDSIFWNSIKNNLYFVGFSIFFEIPLGLYLAIVLNGKMIRRSGIFKTVFFMPVVIPTVVLALITNMVLNYQIGLVNTLLRQVGLGDWARNWLGDPQFSILLLCFIVVWQYTGLFMVIFLAALQNVPDEVLEAAEMDGCTGMKRTRLITVPMITDTILASMVLCISGALRTFELIYATTNGGPNNATDVAATYMFNQTFVSMKYGYGNAIAFFTLLISLLLILASYVFFRKR